MQLLQERDFGQKVNAVFEFLKLNFVPLMTAMLYITGPAAIIAGMALGVYQSSMLSVLGVTETTSGGNPFLGNIFSTLTPAYFIYIFLFIIASIFASLTVYGYVLEYEERGGNVPSITPLDVWGRVKENILSYIGYSILLFIIVIFATCFLSAFTTPLPSATVSAEVWSTASFTVASQTGGWPSRYWRKLV